MGKLYLLQLTSAKYLESMVYTLYLEMVCFFFAQGTENSCIFLKLFFLLYFFSSPNDVLTKVTWQEKMECMKHW